MGLLNIALNTPGESANAASQGLLIVYSSGAGFTSTPHQALDCGTGKSLKLYFI